MTVGPSAVAVSVTVQLDDEADPSVGCSVHRVGVKLPGPAKPKETIPVGGVCPLDATSVTVAVHVEGWSTTTGIAQLTLVEVGSKTASTQAAPAPPLSAGPPLSAVFPSADNATLKPELVLAGVAAGVGPHQLFPLLGPVAPASG